MPPSYAASKMFSVTIKSSSELLRRHAFSSSFCCHIILPPKANKQHLRHTETIPQILLASLSLTTSSHFISSAATSLLRWQPVLSTTSWQQTSSHTHPLPFLPLQILSSSKFIVPAILRPASPNQCCPREQPTLWQPVWLNKQKLHREFSCWNSLTGKSELSLSELLNHLFFSC